MRKALFLDRDGVVNIDKNYVFKQDDFEFMPGIFDLCRRYQNDGYLIFIVTNQAGIARKIFTEEDFLQLTEWMLSKFTREGIKISKVYYCPHHPEFTGSCNCRKPEPGMLIRAAEEFDIDLPGSVLIGDKLTDILAGMKAGLNKCFYIQDVLCLY